MNKYSVIDRRNQQRNVARSMVNSNLVLTQPRHGVLALPSTGNAGVINKQTKRHKDLCFWCDKKLVPGHRCSKKQLYSLTVESDGTEVVEEVEDWKIGKKIIMEEIETPQLSVHALT